MSGSSSLDHRSPMPVNYVRNLVELMAASGVPTDQLLAQAGLTHEQVFSDEAQLRFAQFRAVMLAGRQLSGDAAIGLHLGKQLALTAHGLLGYAVISSANPAQVMKLLQRYFCTRTRLLAPSFVTDEQGGELQFHEMMDLGDIRQTYVEVTVAAVVNAMHFILGESVNRCCLILPYRSPAHAERYHQLLEMPVQFGGTTLTLTIPAGLLEKPLAMADAESRQQAMEQCEEQLQQLEADQDIKARVRQQLMQAEVDWPSVDELAERFYMTSRTLRRRLALAETTYQALLDDVRRLRAIHYLDNHQPVQQVAWLLGYTDRANFTRAFRKWTGQSPSAYLAST